MGRLRAQLTITFAHTNYPIIIHLFNCFISSRECDASQFNLKFPAAPPFYPLVGKSIRPLQLVRGYAWRSLLNNWPPSQFKIPFSRTLPDDENRFTFLTPQALVGISFNCNGPSQPKSLKWSTFLGFTRLQTEVVPLLMIEVDDAQWSRFKKRSWQNWIMFHSILGRPKWWNMRKV